MLGDASLTNKFGAVVEHSQRLGRDPSLRVAKVGMYTYSSTRRRDLRIYIKFVRKGAPPVSGPNHYFCTEFARALRVAGGVTGRNEFSEAAELYWFVVVARNAPEDRCLLRAF